MTMPEDKPKEDPKYFRWFVFIAFLCISAAIGYGFAMYFAFDEENSRGLFGDSFGALNALFSALAFSAVVVTLWMQRNELKQQREELELQRDELQLTRTEHANHNELFQAQLDNSKTTWEIERKVALSGIRSRWIFAPDFEPKGNLHNKPAFLVVKIITNKPVFNLHAENRDSFLSVNISPEILKHGFGQKYNVHIEFTFEGFPIELKLADILEDGSEDGMLLRWTGIDEVNPEPKPFKEFYHDWAKRMGISERPKEGN